MVKHRWKVNQFAGPATATLLAAAGASSGATVGLYRFDTIADSTDTPGGEVFFDSSGNNLSLVNQWQSWSPGVSGNVPAGAPSGSLSLLDPYVPFLQTSNTGLFSLGNTGQLSIEFRYKPMTATGIHYIAGQSNANNGWLMYQRAPVAGKAAIEFYATTNSGSVLTLTTPAVFDADSPWSHIALTVDAAGTARFYQNGAQVASQTGLTGFAPYNASLKLGAQPGTGTYTNHFLMDDLRISNVALPAGSGSGQNELAWNASLSQGLPSNVVRSADFGRWWLREHPFMISSWLSTADAGDLHYYRDANMTASNGGWYLSHDDYGVEQHYLGGYVALSDSARAQMHIANNLPNLTGWLVADEILPEQIAGVAQVADYIRSIDPDGIIYAGMGSSDPTYITQVVQAVKPDALIHGYYPFTGTSGTDVNGHFADFVFYRAGALQNNLPFFVFIQAFDDSHTANNRRLPSESELRFEAFTKITGGAQGISYFVFDTRIVYPTAINAILDQQGDPSSLYVPAKQMNAEILNLGRSLRYLQTTEWRYVRGMTGSSNNPVPTHMVAFTPDASIDPHVLAVSVDTANAANKGALKDGTIGWFDDDIGETYFMLTNVFHGTGLTSAQTSLSFLVQFDNAIDSILRINRITGEPEKLTLNNHVLNITLPGGTGELFKYHNGKDFAGIPSGDANLDGDVDMDDLSILASFYGITTGGRWGKADFDFDADVDLADLTRLATNYRGGQAQALADFQTLVGVPEPGLAVAVIPAAIAIFSRFRRPRAENRR